MNEPPQGIDPFRLEPARDLGMPLDQRARSLRREVGLVDTILHALFWGLVRIWLRVWHRLRIDGRERLPARLPFILVANHSSHVDVFALGAALPARQRLRLFPVAAGDVFFETPVTALFSAFVLNALPMWRKSVGRHALDELRARLVPREAGGTGGDDALILFPEGTRSRTGAMAPFKPGIGMLVAGTTIPVVPCRIEGAHAAWPPGRRLPRFARVRVIVGAPREFSAVTNDRAGWEKIAAELESAVSSLR